MVTDSTADLSKELAEKHNIPVIPLKVFFGDDEYSDGVTLAPDEFIKKIKTSKTFPRTSQPSPGEFLNLYNTLGEQGFKKIISLHISSKLSGTVDSAKIAKSMVKSLDIRVIDTLTTSLGLGLITLWTASFIENTDDIDGVVKKIESQLTAIKIFFTVKTLTYLSKGGRIGKAQAFVGNLLGLKPLLALQDGQGEIVPVKKVKGKKKVLDEIIDLIVKSYSNSKCMYGIGVAHSCMEEEADYLLRTLSKRIPDVEIITSRIGCVIGSHVGPEVIGAGIF